VTDTERVRSVIRAGLAGDMPDTPKPGHPSLARATARVIGSRIDAMAGAQAAAIERGYRPFVIAEPVTGEARIAGPAWLDRARTLIGSTARQVCVISSGETTVRVTGKGTGGRSLEFALSIADAIASLPYGAAASIGTDGIDGSSGVAGGIVDSTTTTRAARVDSRLRNYLVSERLVRILRAAGRCCPAGAPDTNVGRLQYTIDQGRFTPADAATRAASSHAARTVARAQDPP
jgi:glycerate-2-kinase